MFLYLKRFKQNLTFRAKPLHREISVGPIVYYKDPLHFVIQIKLSGFQMLPMNNRYTKVKGLYGVKKTINEVGSGVLRYSIFQHLIKIYII